MVLKLHFKLNGKTYAIKVFNVVNDAFFENNTLSFYSELLYEFKGSVVLTRCFSLVTHLHQTDLLHVPTKYYPYFENPTRKKNFPEFEHEFNHKTK